MDHFKSIGKKRLDTCIVCGRTQKKHGDLEHEWVGEDEQACAGLKAEKVRAHVMLWAKPLEFKASKVGLLGYQQALKHLAVTDRRSQKITFDENAIKRLMVQYPKDPLYPLIGKQRYLSKMLGTYVGVRGDDGIIIGGMPVGKDGRGHPIFSHNPSTLRLSCPFFHTLPRPGKPDEPHTWIRNMIVAAPGHVYVARDFSGIEAVLVGYEARSPRYIRLAKMDVHSFYTAYALYELDRRISANDLPQLESDDARLQTRLAEIKQTFKEERNNLYKHLVHALGFGQGPRGAQEKILKETDVIHPLAKISKAMGVYMELFPEIPRWHYEVREQAAEKGFLTNAFGYVHRFYSVWKYQKVNGKWDKKPGDDAQAVLAFRPQSNAAGIIKEVMLRLFEERLEEAGQWLRLQVHDELFCECPEGLADVVDGVLKDEMEKPIPELRLPASYGMGDHLSILTEGKRGERWGTMK